MTSTGARQNRQLAEPVSRRDGRQRTHARWRRWTQARAVTLQEPLQSVGLQRSLLVWDSSTPEPATRRT
eukprot:6044685-Alexandrium_andersonii.AAC.1